MLYDYDDHLPFTRATYHSFATVVTNLDTIYIYCPTLDNLKTLQNGIRFQYWNYAIAFT